MAERTQTNSAMKMGVHMVDAGKALLSGGVSLAAVAFALGAVGGTPAEASQFNFQCPADADPNLGLNEYGEVMEQVSPGVWEVIRLDGSTNPNVPAATLCLHVTGGDGTIRMADGRSLYSFGFSPVGVETHDGTVANWIDGTGSGAGGAVWTPADDNADAGKHGYSSFLPAPLLRFAEGQEVYLTLSNTPFVVRPDLFDPHSVHYHGFPNASAVFDGVPDNSVSPNPLASLTYYYQVVRPGTYMWHCHVEAAEHMQMGMLGNLYVEPAQNWDGSVAPGTYAYNDGDGSTAYDLEMPLQIHTYDPDFHQASHDVQPLPFADMNDRYAMFNGRGYPDTVRTDPFLNANPDAPGARAPDDSGGLEINSQPETSLIEAAPLEKVLVRLTNLSTTDIMTIVSPDLTMNIIGQGGYSRTGPGSGYDDVGGTQVYYETHQVTLGGGQAFDAIVEIPASAAPGDRFFIYTSNLNFLANDTEDYGGLMTEIHVVAG